MICNKFISEFLSFQKKNEIELNKLKAQILDQESLLGELKARLNLNSYVNSNTSGKIIELMVNPGEVIQAGSVLLTIEPNIKPKQ